MKFLLYVIASVAIATLSSCSGRASQTSISKPALASEDTVAGTLMWSGDANGKHTFKTATCTLGLDDQLVAVSAPHEVENVVSVDGPSLGIDEPYLSVSFTLANNGVMVVFAPNPNNMSVRNLFGQVRRYGEGVSWEKTGGHYVLRLRHYDDVASDIEKNPMPEWHVFLTGDITCTKIKNP